MANFIRTLLFVFGFISIQGQIIVLYEGDQCQISSTNSTGTCKKLSSCLPALDDIKMKTERPQICSFVRTEPIVCCPEPQQLSLPIRLADYAVDKSAQMCQCYKNRRAVDKRVECQEPRDTKNTLVFRTTLDPQEELVDPRIFGGEAAASREFPHMVAVGYGPADNVEWRCGGSLISKRFVLTAAHCIADRSSGKASYVRLGDLNPDARDTYDSRQLVRVVDWIVHPQYTSRMFYNDVGLLRLEKGVVFSSYAHPACLYTDDFREGRICTATGWGLTGLNSTDGSKDLLKVNLTVQHPRFCTNTYEQIIKKGAKLASGIRTDSMICAGEPRGNKDTCAGDSGGPLQVFDADMYHIIGVTSFGVNTCGPVTEPAVYMRVSHYVPWIVQNVWPQPS